MTDSFSAGAATRQVDIIAEIGINHNGDLAIAKRLIDMAKAAGCDAVKFQKRTIDQVYTPDFLDSPREMRPEPLSAMLRDPPDTLRDQESRRKLRRAEGLRQAQGRAPRPPEPRKSKASGTWHSTHQTSETDSKSTSTARRLSLPTSST